MRPSLILALVLLASLLASPAFGAPADDPRPIVQASEILAKIERGEPVEYDGVIIEGDLDLSGLDLPTSYFGMIGIGEYEQDTLVPTIHIRDFPGEVKLVESSIRITKSEIRDGVNLGSAIFQGPVNFMGTNFASEALFSGANFSGHKPYIYLGGSTVGSLELSPGSPDFRESTFSRNANFFKTEFCGDAFFFGAEFHKDAIFYGSKFRGDANFHAANFSDGGAYFEGAVFGGKYTNFGEAVFGGNANFMDPKFRSPFRMNVSEDIISEDILLGSANFRETEFSGGEANFDGAVFLGGDAYFETAKFGGNTKFGNVLFGNDAYFRDAQFDGDAYFQLAKFTGVLDLVGIDFTRLYINWNSIERPVCDGVTYLKLVKNFKDLEQFEDADSCYYNYRKWRQGEKSFLSWSKYIDILAWLTCGYGVRPGYTLKWSFSVIALFGFAFWTGNGIFRISFTYHDYSNEDQKREWRFSSICHLIFNKISNILNIIIETPNILIKMLFALLKTRPSTLYRLLSRIWNASFVTEISFKDALYFSTMVFVSMPPHDWRPKEGWKYAVMLEDVLGWLLLALFLVTLGNVMIR